MTRLRVAVLLSGEGSSLENLCEHIEAGKVPAEVVLAIASRATAGGLARARRRGIPAHAIPRREHPGVTAFNDAIHALLERHDVDLVAPVSQLEPQLRRDRSGSAVRRIACDPDLHPSLPSFVTAAALVAACQVSNVRSTCSSKGAVPSSTTVPAGS